MNFRVKERDFSPFHRDLKGLFPILDGDNEKVGEIEVELTCKFNSELNKLFKMIAEDTRTYSPEVIIIKFCQLFINFKIKNINNLKRKKVFIKLNTV